MTADAVANEEASGNSLGTAAVARPQEVRMPKMHLGNLTITSPAFKHGDPIPTEHAGDGADVSPELNWQAVPSGTRQLALVCHDADAPLTFGFTHWVVYGIPADSSGIPKGGGSAFTEGPSSFGDQGRPVRGHRFVLAARGLEDGGQFGQRLLGTCQVGARSGGQLSGPRAVVGEPRTLDLEVSLRRFELGQATDRVTCHRHVRVHLDQVALEVVELGVATSFGQRRPSHVDPGQRLVGSMPFRVN